MIKSNKYKLENGWIVEKNKHNKAILHVTPIPNSIFRIHKDIEIPENIFQEIETGERDIKKLFRKYKLHDLIMQWKQVGTISDKFRDTENYYHGTDFILTKEKNKFFIKYQLARHGGGSRKFEISKEIYEDARKGNKSTSDLFKKYNLYHLDVPENDVK